MEIMKIRPIWTPFRFVQMHEQSSAPTPLVLLALWARVGFSGCRKTKLLFANTLKEYTLNLHPEFCFSCIKDICELTGKSRKEVEVLEQTLGQSPVSTAWISAPPAVEMLEKDDIFELKLTEK